jgi:hypothetical protein
MSPGDMVEFTLARRLRIEGCLVSHLLNCRRSTRDHTCDTRPGWHCTPPRVRTGNIND